MALIPHNSTKGLSERLCIYGRESSQARGPCAEEGPVHRFDAAGPTPSKGRWCPARPITGEPLEGHLCAMVYAFSL
jgi:hypothetical protein